jgi:NAD-dependent SIR2 family protein deacetylase
VGVDAVFGEFFGRVLQDFEDWRTTMSELFDAGDRVIAIGTSKTCTPYSASSSRARSP